GRQGDANREVYFWLRDGKIPVDLSAKTIKLFAKDASGVVKETETVNDRTGITSGHFSLLIPKEFYQASGDVQDAYIQISDGNQIISTIPVAFTVLENTMVVTQTQSQVYLDTVQQTINDFKARIATVATNLETIENTQKTLQSMIDNINQEFNSDNMAKRKEDNDFTAKNTFEQAIIAKGGVTGNADTATKATDADHATNADNATNATKATTADTLTAGNNQTVGDLTVNGQIRISSGQNFYKSSFSDAFGLQGTMYRFNNVVYLIIYGNAKNTGPGTWVGNILAGYRPVDNHYFSAESQNDRMIAMSVTPNGRVNISSLGTSNGGEHGLFASTMYLTSDSYPA
ncbi:hypothetical protein H7198_05390, partial [Fructobacillus sp. CRL 2054]